MEQKPLDIIVQNLLKQLDRVPRVHFESEIQMAVQAAKDLGHAEGFRMANTGIVPQKGADAAPQSQGEDKTLSTDRMTPEEETEAIGNEILSSLARQLGRLSRMGYSFEFSEPNTIIPSPIDLISYPSNHNMKG